ncbi:uncharacterized protein CcaverHIS019_0307720 [Cutaneotrichosporon cavernicola]|uniref:Uncharacterized protein n=1 Tax=Cutaneotrichosporon cavernicola TaxID=279322 RepID=A0AA48I7G8_9TREE|nr:uncharacterized protein CcaverHIS019_0307720 [Cutaneotrichosporon cavernicola]BEI90702.1 hypothetical protein CcaverHIS019_0307720 [Cutaneotrichosporon cavernicola]BEI98480.1 hypothetical protein CcaverHIS631_0307790 [Cutaneotrichosporon cavernicola]BEJ06253.1 hypothetical protein CcaverHIS641_0307750 [Cutaneotrichosporon cavernicola]
MLTRRLAGPSRASLMRQLASAAVAEAPPPAHAAREHRQLAEASRLRPLPPDQLSSQMNALVNSAKERGTNRARADVYESYTSLSPLERASLSPENMRAILRAIVPRHDAGWRAVQRSSPRKRKAMNDTLADTWGRKLRTVIAEMVQRDIDTRADWHFILQTLLKVGAVSAVESIWQVLPAKLRKDREFAELRLGTVSRWAKNARDAFVAPLPDELDTAYRAFWDAFTVFQDPSVKTVPITHRILCVASADLAALMHRVGQRSLETARIEDAFEALHRILRVVLEKGYGVDIDAIPSSADRLAETPGQFRAMPPVVLNAVLDHLSVSGRNAHQLFAAFDVLTSETPVPNKRAFEEEEDDDVPNLANATAQAESDPDRTNWWGRKMNRAAYFESAPAPSGEPTPSHASDPISSTSPPDFQTIRSVSDYLPKPVWPLQVVADASKPAAKERYDADTVVLLLRAARREDEWGLLQRILEVSVADALATDSAWLSVYLATPPAERINLPRPGRISPEWFASALAEYTQAYDRHAQRTVSLLEKVVAWTAQKIEVVTASETPHCEFKVVEGGEHERIVLAPPDVSPKELRFMRNKRSFLAHTYLARLYRDLDEFAKYLPRAAFQAERRKGWKASARERKGATELEREEEPPNWG